jgi:pilus assembly protein FimV
MDMFRKFAIAAVVLSLCATSRVFAIGLGDIQIQSSLNDPLKAVIELTSGTRQELDELKVSIAPPDAFKRMGISRPPILDDVKFSVEQPQNGLPVILVTTRQPVREPFLDLLIEASWSKGRLLRQYTLLVDPPVTMPAEPPAQRAPVRQSAAPAVGVRKAPAPVREQVATPVVTPPARAAASTEAEKYGPVKRNETLWDIAKRVRPDGNISMQQMMIALLRSNPEAFAGNNINNLRAGTTLQIPSREEILALDKSAARREASRQYTEWQQGRAAEQAPATAKETETTPEQAQPPQAASAPAPANASAPAAKAAESHLQLVAPDEEAIKGAAVPGAAEEGTGTATQQAAGSQQLLQQLALASQEAETGRAQTEELQSRVGKLEEKVADMQRLIELKDEQLANLQNRLAAQNQAASGANEPAPAETAPKPDKPAAQPPASSRETGAASGGTDGKAPSMIDRLLENPVLAGLGVLVAMVLGGFLWSSARHRKQEDIFSEEPTLASQLAASRYEEPPPVQPRVEVSDSTMLSDLAATEMSPLHGDDASDPLTEADVFIAYGRVQKAEEVIRNALQHNPDSRELIMKLLEIYHAAGNVAAFDVQAAAFRESVGVEDADWQRVTGMGYELSPANPLYQTATAEFPARDGEVDFDMDLAGTDEHEASVSVPDTATGLDYDNVAAAGEEAAAEVVSFDLDDLNTDMEDENLTDGLLQESDEIGTKLDLARAYMDMGDPDGARGILEEVIEEGNDEQKNEAESLIAQLA